MKYREDTPKSESNMNREFMPESLDFSSVYKPSKRNVPTKATSHPGTVSDSDQNNNVVDGNKKMLGQGSRSKDPLDASARSFKPPKVRVDIDFSKSAE